MSRGSFCLSKRLRSVLNADVSLSDAQAQDWVVALDRKSDFYQTIRSKRANEMDVAETGRLRSFRDSVTWEPRNATSSRVASTFLAP